MKALLVLASLLLPGLCWADTFQSVKEARIHIDKIMARVASGQIEEGVKMIKPYSILPAAELDALIGQLPMQVPAIAQRFGKPLETEFLAEERVGTSLVRFAYLQKYERHAMRWAFLLYKGPQGWVINTFVFDDKIHELFPVRPHGA